MSSLLNPLRNPRIGVASTLLVVAALTALASGQIGAAKAPARHFEYFRQEVRADALTQSMNDLDGQGWEVFQIIPIWQLKNENAETVLSPRAYEILGRRIFPAK